MLILLKIFGLRKNKVYAKLKSNISILVKYYLII